MPAVRVYWEHLQRLVADRRLALRADTRSSTRRNKIKHDPAKLASELGATAAKLLGFSERVGLILPVELKVL